MPLYDYRSQDCRAPDDPAELLRDQAATLPGLQGFARRFKPLDLRTEEEVEAIHRGALYVLAKTGMRVEHEQALRLVALSSRLVDHG